MFPIRDVVLLLIFVGLVPVSLFRPWLGVLAWCWIAFFAPHMLTWGFARSIPVAMLVGGATLVGFMFTRDRKPLPRTVGVVLLVLFIVHVTITTVLAMNQELSWGKWEWVMKSLLMTFVAMSLFQDRERLRWLYLVPALSIGFFGFKGGIWVLVTGGGERVFGPEGTFFGDNNELGLALCMMLPLLVYLAREEPRPWLKRILRLVFGFSIVGILGTYSRGALVGLLAVAGLLVWRSPWRKTAIIVAVVLAVSIAPFMPDKWWGRMDTITDEKVDSSVQGRFNAWSTVLNLAADHPLFGGGFRVMADDYTWYRYFDGYSRGEFIKAWDPHSIYFDVLGEHGYIGLAIYLLIILATLVSLQQIRKRWRGHPEYGYLSNYADMSQLALCPFLVAGSFLSLAYFDLFFHLLGTTFILQALSLKAAKDLQPDKSGRRIARAVPAPALQPAPVVVRAVPLRRRIKRIPHV
jgi:probable O-glycosylation ligase (exosortase A-associated)